MDNWIGYSPASGHGNGQITITAQTLSGLQERVTAIIATNDEYSLTDNTTIIQKNIIITAITFSNVSWVNDVPSSGGTATKDNCSYTIYAFYEDGTQVDITDAATVSGSLSVSPSTLNVRHQVGTLTLTATYNGQTCSTTVDVYQGAYYFAGLTFIVNSTGTISWSNSRGREYCRPIMYMIADKTDWTELRQDSFVASSGDIVYFKSVSNEQTIPPAYGSTWESDCNTFSGTTINFSVCGNSLSLIYRDTYDDKITAYTATPNLFSGLFDGCTYLTSAKDLILPRLRNYGSSQTPRSGSYRCFEWMFKNCVNLTEAPTLPSNELAEGCFASMFAGCTNLVNAPELPVTTLAPYCYERMFENCYSITPPSLPSTTLANYCYYYMFKNCIYLTSSPDLSAETLVHSCYLYMFEDCSSLRTVKCLATDISAINCTKGWLKNVSGSGFFIKNQNMDSWTYDENGIPAYWTVIDET